MKISKVRALHRLRPNQQQQGKITTSPLRGATSLLRIQVPKAPQVQLRSGSCPNVKA